MRLLKRSVPGMKDTPRRRITVTSSLIEISMEPLGNRMGGRRYSARPHSFLQQVSGQIFKADVNGFSFTSDICFMAPRFRWKRPQELFPCCQAKIVRKTLMPTVLWHRYDFLALKNNVFINKPPKSNKQRNWKNSRIRSRIRIDNTGFICFFLCSSRVLLHVSCFPAFSHCLKIANSRKCEC
jgi:hypothetical protein